MSALWEQALLLIRQEVGEQGFETWFRPIRSVTTRDHTLVVEVPNQFSKDWVLEHYKETIDRSLLRVAGRPVQVELTAGTTPAVQEPPAVFVPPPAATPKAKPEELGLNAKYTMEAFVVGLSNRFAHPAAVAVGNAPAKAYNPLSINGGVGLGKTHLLHAIGHLALRAHPRARVLYISSEQFTNQLITAIQTRSTVRFRERYRTVDLLMIDDIQFIAGKEATPEEFFHTFNALYEAHKQIVLSSDRSPKEIRSLEERLVSRFEWGLVTDIQPPDLETRIAILRKKAEAHRMPVPDDVATFIAERVRSNIRELEGALIRVVAYSSLVGQEITLALAQEVLKDMVLEEAKRISIEAIQQRVAEYFEIRPTDMRARRRTKQVAYPRQVAMYLARRLTDASLPEIGEQFGGRDHSTVLYACGKVEEMMRKQADIRGVVEHLAGVVRG